MRRTALGFMLVLCAAAPRMAAAQGDQGVPVGSVPAPAGIEVNVKRLNGPGIRGHLVSLSPAEVVVRVLGMETTLPLAKVKQVERRTKTVRTAALRGMLIGMPVAVLAFHCGGECAEDLIQIPTLAGIGAGAGALIGAFVGLAANEPLKNRLLYRASPASHSVAIAPMLTGKVAGITMTMKW